MLKQIARTRLTIVLVTFLIAASVLLAVVFRGVEPQSDPTIIENICLPPQKPLLVTTDTTLKGNCVLKGGIIIREGVTLTVAAGSEITLNASLGWIYNRGNLVIAGQPDNPCKLFDCGGINSCSGVGKKDDDGKYTYWGNYEGSAEVHISYAFIEFAGGAAEVEPPITADQLYDVPRKYSMFLCDAAKISILNSDIILAGQVVVERRLCRGKTVDIRGSSFTWKDNKVYLPIHQAYRWRMGFNIYGYQACSSVISAWDARVEDCVFRGFINPFFTGRSLICGNSTFFGMKEQYL